jgi:hypothetical protein
VRELVQICTSILHGKDSRAAGLYFLHLYDCMHMQKAFFRNGEAPASASIDAYGALLKKIFKVLQNV